MKIVTASEPKVKKKWSKQKVKLFLIAVPFIIYVLIFSYVPLFGWALAFFNYKPGIPLSKTPFVGLYNFKMMFTTFGPEVGNSLVNTFVLSFLGLACSVLPVIFAIMLTEAGGRKYKKLIQSLSTLPNFISWVIIFSFAFSIFSIQGMLNTTLQNLNIISQPIDFLGDPDIAWAFQTALSSWKGIGWSAIVYLAAIAGIDQELYDAAKIDGAGRLQRVIHITVPGVQETFFVLLLLSLSSILSSSLDQYMVFYNSLVAEKLDVLDYFVYRMGLKLNNYSFSIAVGMAKTAVSLVLLFGVNWVSKKVRGYSLI